MRYKYTFKDAKATRKKAKETNLDSGTGKKRKHGIYKKPSEKSGKRKRRQTPKIRNDVAAGVEERSACHRRVFCFSSLILYILSHRVHYVTDVFV